LVTFSLTSVTSPEMMPIKSENNLGFSSLSNILLRQHGSL